MNTKIIWAIRLIIAGIFLQTLYFKLTGSAESIFIFSQIGLEPLGRYVVGFAELAASILILIPATSFYGAVLALFIIVPALFFHLTTLGISVQGDHGLLFGLALIVLVLSITLGSLTFPKKALPKN